MSFLVKKGISNLALPLVIISILLTGMYGEALLFKASKEGRLYTAIRNNNAPGLERLLERKKELYFRSDTGRLLL